MTCPRCAYDQPDGAAECQRCGIVFSKYRAKDRQTRTRAAAPAGEETPSPGGGTTLRDLLLYAAPGAGILPLIARACLLLFIAAWGMKFIFSGIQSNYAGGSFMHLINLPFHEAGHILFGMFGRFMTVLGGSLTQCLVPLICLITFLLKTRDPFAASVSLWWLGENLIDLAPYINDARSLSLILLGGVTGRDVDDYHDWEYLLGTLGIRQHDHLLAAASHAAGALLMVAACLWGGAVLFIQYRNRNEGA